MQPRDVVVDQWHRAFREAASSLVATDHGVKILSGHLTLYNSERSEFYSAIDPRLFSNAGLEVSRIIIVFDDIFDTYRRLSMSAPNALIPAMLDEKVRFPKYKARQWETLRVSGEPGFNPSMESLLLRELRVQGLLQLLAWRRAELVQAELLARQLKAVFLPIAVKHASEIADPFFREQGSNLLVMAGHPVS